MVSDQASALSDLGGAGGDQGFDFFRRLSGTLSQSAHFGGDHCEAAPCVSGSGRFDASIQGKQICLKGDLVNNADDLCDLG